METIFDHNVTKEELMMLFAYDGWTAETYVEGLTQYDCYRHIYKLYLLRNDQDKADEYAAKCPDTVEKIFGWLNHDFAK